MNCGNLRGVEPKIRLAYLVTHPIQYQAPLLRQIAAEPGIDLTVFFCSDFSLKSYHDPDFGKTIAWDIPLHSPIPSNMWQFEKAFLANPGFRKPSRTELACNSIPLGTSLNKRLPL
jgi:hypothetical protein